MISITRTAPAALIALGLMSSTAACTGGGDPIAPCEPLTTASLTIIKDVTENAPTAVPAEIECLVTQAFKDRKPVSVIAADGVPAVTLAEWVAPVRTNNKTVFHDDLPAAFASLREAFVPADDDGLDLLKAFSLAGDLGDDSTVVVLSSGLQDAEPLSFPRPGLLAADADELATQVVQSGALTSGGGITNVIWLGAGYAVNEQTLLTDREVDQVRQIWATLLAKVGIPHVTFVSGLGSSTNAVDTEMNMTATISGPIGSVDLPPDQGPRAFVYDGSTPVTFVKDTAVFIKPDEAQATLVLLAEYIANSGSCSVEIAGTTAEVSNYTHDQSRPLALSRANAVRDALTGLGVDSACMTTVGYAGSESPWYVENYPNQIFDAVAAGQNRAVHVTVTAP